MARERQWYHIGAAEGDGAGAPADGRATSDPFGAPHGYAAGTRAQEEAAAVEQILGLYPADSRQQMRDLLNSDGMSIISSTDANVARLLETIYEIRRHDDAARSRDRSRRRAQEHSAVVGIAWRDNAPSDSPAVVVYRRITKHPANVIVLNGSRVSAQHLVAGLVALNRSRQQFGDELPLSQTIRITTVPADVPEHYDVLLARAERALSQLRAKPMSQTDGFGAARTTTIRIPPVSPPRD